MKKLKLEKLKLNDLSAGDQKNVLGGNVQPASWVTTVTTISIASYLVNSCIECTDTLQNGCFTQEPGHQDSCGLCTTNYRCY